MFSLSPTRWGRGLAAALALLVSPLAHAQDLEVRLDAVDEVVESLLRSSRGLEGQVAPGSGYIREDQAVQRFQDYLYLHLIDEHEAAAEGFFALVTSGALGDAGLHRDAEWYLADSLFLMDNLSTAESRFLVIANDSAHPFRADAVRRLLELYAKSRQSKKFYEIYEREIVRGRVAPSDLITYSVAKAFYTQGDIGKAKAHFQQVSPDSGWYGKARYFYGAIMVAEQRLDEATLAFQEVSELSVETVDDQQVHDLALLALGRLSFELGEHAAAADHYNAIGGDSEYSDDKLFELVWTYIEMARVEKDWDKQQAAWQSGLRGIEIFLLAFPEHEYTAQLRLLEGHLHMAKVEHDSALSSYEQVIANYTPVRDQFGKLAASVSEPRAYFQQVLALGGEGDTLQLPAFAVALMMADPELSRAIDVFREIEQQENDISACEHIIRELRVHLVGDGGIGGFEEMRYDAVLAGSMATEHQLALLEIEEDWLLNSLPVDKRSRIEPLRERRLALIGAVREDKYRVEAARKALEQHRLAIRRVRRNAEEVLNLAASHAKELATLRTQLQDKAGELDSVTLNAVLADIKYLQGELLDSQGALEDLDVELTHMRAPRDQVEASRKSANVDLLAEIESLRLDYSGARKPTRQDLIGSRVDGMHNSLKIVQDRLRKVGEGLDDVEESELALLRTRFEHEVTEVASERITLGETLSEAETVSIGLTREGFGRLEDFFAESVLKADMGIVDVYWSQKLETDDEIERVKEERLELLTELEKRFELIRLKIRK